MKYHICGLMAATASALVLCATAATADEFTYAGIPDGTDLTQSQALTIADPYFFSLEATLTPKEFAGAFVKKAPDQGFPGGSAGFLEEQGGALGGIRIHFNHQVFCFPGGKVGIAGKTPPGMVEFVDWSVLLAGQVVDSGSIDLLSFVIIGGNDEIQIGEFTVPDNLIDQIEISARFEPESGGPSIPAPLLLGDIFAIIADSLAFEGSPSTQSPIHFTLSNATKEPGNLFLVGLSSTGTAGIPLPDGRVLPLTLDAWTLAGLSAAPFLTGVIDAAGSAATPVVPFPALPSGFTIYSAGVTIDLLAGSIVSVTPPISIVSL